MLLTGLTAAQRLDTLNALYEFTAASVAPLLLVESLLVGALCVCVPLGSYMTWIKLRSMRVPLVLSALAFFTALTTHWALSLRRLEDIIEGRALRVTMLDNADVSRINGTDPQILNSYVRFGYSWQFFLPLVNETVLLGFASALFAIMAGITLQRYRSRRQTGFAALIPSIATGMYTMSLLHWVISLRYYAGLENGAAEGFAFGPPGLRLALGTLLTHNILNSDFIVLWRACIIWDRARSVIVFCAALAITIEALNIANLCQRVLDVDVQLQPPGSLNVQSPTPGSPEFIVHDSETIPVYGSTSISLAAAFVSLASNLSATLLVGLKAWLHRRQLAEHMSTANRRTLVARVLELLVESGVIYTGIWVLYCVSFFRPITDYKVDYLDKTNVTAASHLDAAMAQITTIYPLMIFILVALDRIRHDRGPDILSKPEGLGAANRREDAVTITFEVNVERDGTLSPGTSHPMVALGHRDDGCESVKD